MPVRHMGMNGEEAVPIEPISVRIPEAVRMTGLSKSKIYQLIASGDIEAAKVGRPRVFAPSRQKGRVAPEPPHRR